MADNIIRAEDFIDSSDLGNIDKIIDGLDRFNKALDENAKIRKGNADDLAKIRKKEIADLKKLETQLEATKNTTEEGREQTVKLTNAAEEKAKAMEKLVGVEKENQDQLTKIAKLEKQVLALQKDLLKVAKSTNKEKAKTTKRLSEEEKLTAKLEKLKKGELDTTIKLRKQVQEETKAVKERVDESPADAYKIESARLNDMRKDYKKNAVEIKNNTNVLTKLIVPFTKLGKEQKALRKEIKKVDKELKKIDETVGQGQRSVGLYGKAAEGAKSKFGSLSGFLLGVFVGSIEKSRDTSREFQGTIERVSNGARIAGQEIVRFFTDFVAPGLENLSLKFERFQKKADLALTLNPSTRKKLEEDITALDNAIQENTESVEEYNFSWKEVSDTFEKTDANLVQRIERMDRLIDQTALLNDEIQKLQGEEAVLEAQIGNSTISFARRAEKIEELIVVQDKIIAKERELAEAEFQNAATSIRNDLLRRNLIKTNEELSDQQIKDLSFLKDRAKADAIGIDNLGKLTAATSKLNEIRAKEALQVESANKERLENARDLFEQELDFTLDIGDRQKAVNERILKSDKVGLDEKFKILSETEKLLDDSFQEQLRLTEDFIASSLEINEGLSGDEALAKVKELNLERIVGLKDERQIREELFGAGISDEITQNRIREIIIERLAAQQDIVDAQEDLNTQLKEASQTLQKDLDALVKTFESEKLQVDTGVFQELIVLSEKLREIDKDEELTLQERIDRREAVLKEIARIEEEAAKNGIELAIRELEGRKSIIKQELSEIEGQSKEAIKEREDLAAMLIQIDQQITDARKQELDKQFEDYKELNAKQVENEKEKQAELKSLRGEIVTASIQLFNESANIVSSIFDNQVAKQEAIGAEISRQKEHELILAGDNAERRIEIENEFFKREEANRRRTIELQRKQAIFDKAVAITNASVNTALAVAQINANPAVNLDITQTLRSTLTALVIGIGAAQVAAIIASPIPQFWKGTDNAPGGMAIVDEKGAEIRTDKKGRIKDMGQTVGARVVMTNPGDKIYTASESKNLGGLLKDNKDILIPGITQQGFNSSKSKLDQLAILDKINNNQIDEGTLTRAFEKAVKKIPINKFFWDEDGYHKHQEKENSITKYINSTKLGG